MNSKKTEVKVKVRWTEREMNEVIAESAKHLAEGCNEFEAIKEGQKILPKGRQKPDSSILTITKKSTEQNKYFIEDMLAMAGKIIGEKQARSKVTAELIQSIPEVKQFLEKFRSEVRELFDNVISEEVEAARQRLRKELKDIVPATEAPKAPEKTAKKKVLVVGLRSDRQRIMQEKFNTSNLDLRFLHKEYSRVKALAKTSDLVIICTKFVGHIADDLCKDHQNYKRLGSELEIYDFLTKYSQEA